MKKLIQFAKSKGLNPQSKVVQITHFDLDGAGAAIAMQNYFLPGNCKTIYATYETVGQWVKDAYAGNIKGFTKPDFVFLTDIHMQPWEDALKYIGNSIPLIMLDHHEGGLDIANKPECGLFLEQNDRCGAELTYDFLVNMGMKNTTELVTLMQIIGDFDMWRWVANRKLVINGIKTHKAELLNRLFYRNFDRELFVARWNKGWVGSGFTKEEVTWFKEDYLKAQQYIDNLANNAIDIIPNKVIFLMDGKVQYIPDIGLYYREKGYDLVIMYSTDKEKVSVRAHDNYKGNVNDLLMKACNGKGGGHRLSGAGKLSKADMETFLTTIGEESEKLYAND